jgi:hypothetical protein
LSDDGILFKGIAVMALLGIAVGLLAAAATPIAGQKDGYTAMYMNTDTIDRNVTKNHTSLAIPFTVENHEGGKANYHYAVSVLFKDTIFHPGLDSWSEDMNVDEARNIVNGSVALDNGKAQTVVPNVPIQSKQKWRYANVTIDLYKDGTPGIYRSLRLWAINQTSK